MATAVGELGRYGVDIQLPKEELHWVDVKRFAQLLSHHPSSAEVSWQKPESNQPLTEADLHVVALYYLYLLFQESVTMGRNVDEEIEEVSKKYERFGNVLRHHLKDKVSVLMDEKALPGWFVETLVESPDVREFRKRFFGRYSPAEKKELWPVWAAESMSAQGIRARLVFEWLESQYQEGNPETLKRSALKKEIRALEYSDSRNPREYDLRMVFQKLYEMRIFETPHEVSSLFIEAVRQTPSKNVEPVLSKYLELKLAQATADGSDVEEVCNELVLSPDAVIEDFGPKAFDFWQRVLAKVYYPIE